MSNPEDSFAMRLLTSGVVPDWLIRWRIRALLDLRLRREDRGDPQRQQQALTDFIDELRASPIAINTRDANEQHYEVPTAFFRKVLGRHLKYSSGWFDLSAPPAKRLAWQELDAAEERMLALTAERAGIRNGERVLELGCGWGSLSLWLARQFPDSQITSVSNSRTQKEYIDAQAAERSLGNLRVITCDINALQFGAGETFDRVVSVEMFEHMRNYEVLLGRIAGWMNPGATLFVHIFTHQRFSYPFEAVDDTDWMARHFFTGGIMPGNDLLHYFQRDLQLQRQWLVDGRHYQLTAEAWLSNMDRHRDLLLPLLAQTYGADQQRLWWVYWRVFFMACAELWGYREGREWMVSHYLFAKG